MTKDAFLQALYNLSFEAGMNQQYYQTKLAIWTDYDSSVRAWLLIFTMGCLMVTIFEKRMLSWRKKNLTALQAPAAVPAGVPERVWRVWIATKTAVVKALFPLMKSLTWSIAAMVAALLLVVYPTEAPVRLNTDLYREWTSVRATVDTLELSAKNEPGAEALSPCLVDRLKDVTAKIADIMAKEPAPDTKLVQQCYDAESERRWGKGVKSYQDRLDASEKGSKAASSPKSSAIR